ncbi:hypothetical protein [Haloflavibacter putidus]|uniref:Thioredoxin domain-containing protein n=1 Tax=Haloflavibacter putidus TaxID=2576776 RepID=A0A507ZQT8_9FLAO|nr:hypothetical protein [Haloflavibacter putidus]TQD39317.1 hypothetical protein FKR84_05335 [Haloflavibacter putidus]
MRFSLLVLLSSISFIFLSCEDESEPIRTYFSGEIVNPTSDLLTLERQDIIVDSIYLNDKNKFSYQFSEDAEGLYTFRHAPETQIFYIEKGDSLLVHLNTLEFDESMMYSGKGAAKNNFLMEMFLLNEANNDLLFSYYKIPPSDFAAKTDSIKKRREIRLNQLATKHTFSDSFKSLAQKTIDYEFYGLLERYSFLIKKYVEAFQNQFPEGFYAYRNQVDFNDKDLQGHYIYRRFLDNFLKNKSIDYCLENNMDRNCFRLHSINNLQRRIRLADSIFSLPDLKHRFVKSFAKREIIYSEKPADIDTALQVINDFDLSAENKQKLRDLAEIQSSFLTGHDISNKTILDNTLEKVAFKNISDKPKVLFYWSIYSGEQHKRQHAIINKLRNKYPEIAFIGINIDAGETELWQKTIENFDYHEEFEYQIVDVGNKKPLYRNYLNNILFVNGNSIIKDGRLQLDDSNLEDYILQFLNM